MLQPITTTGAAIANALFDATGARIFRLPITPERVRQAMAKLNPSAPASAAQGPALA